MSAAGWTPQTKRLLVDYLRRHRESCRPPQQSNFSVGMLALTYRCQCSCPHCGISAYAKTDKRILNPDEIRGILDEFARLDVKWVNFFGGEPLLDRNLPDYIRYAKRQGLTAVIDSNGLLLTEDRVKTLKSAGLDALYVSIDSPHADVHDEFRGVKGLFDKAMAGARFCQKHDLPCVLSPFATKENLRNGELKQIIELAKGVGARVRINSPIHSGKLAEAEGALFSGEEVRLLRSVLETGRVFWEIPGVDSADAPFRCDAGKVLFSITAYGDVQPCCFCGVSFGNVRETALGDILARMSRSRMFKGFGDGDCPLNDAAFRDSNSEMLRSGLFHPAPEAGAGAAYWDAQADIYASCADRVFAANDALLAEKTSFRGLSVLDAGCGTGRFAAAIAAQARAVTLCDSSTAMLERARQRLAAFANTDFAAGDISLPGFALGKTFDRIIAAGFLRHAENQRQALDNLKAHLNDGGKLLIIDVVSGGGEPELIAFHLKLIKELGFAAWQEIFLDGESAALMASVMGGRMMAFDECARVYARSLPGASVEKFNGVFVLAEWEKPGGRA